MAIYLNYVFIAVAIVYAAPSKLHSPDHKNAQSVETTYEYHSGIIPKNQAAHWNDFFPTGSGVYEREYVSREYVKYDKNGNVIVDDFQSEEYINGKKVPKLEKSKHKGQ